MKKIVSSIIAFMYLLVMSGVFFVSNNDNVLAAEEKKPATISCNYNFALESTLFDGCEIDKTVGKLKITRGGQITVSYKYGITELLVYAIAIDENGTRIPTIKPQLIHAAGDVVEEAKVNKNQWEARTVHLYDYFGENVRVKFQLVYEFAGANDYNEYISANGQTIKNENNFFYKLYCNTGQSNCDYTGNTKKYKNLKYRMDFYIGDSGNMCSGEDVCEIKESDVAKTPIDRSQIVYRGNATLSSAKQEWFQSSVIKANNTPVSHADSVIVLTKNTAFEAEKANVEEIIYDTVIPALLGVLGIAAIVSCTILGYQIVKSADEPQERADKVKRLKQILFGIAIAFLLLMAVEPITNLIKGYMEE